MQLNSQQEQNDYKKSIIIKFNKGMVLIEINGNKGNRIKFIESVNSVK